MARQTGQLEIEPPSTPRGPLFNPGGDFTQEAPAAGDLASELLDDERRRQRQKDELDMLRARRQEDIASGKEFIKDFALQGVNRPGDPENTRLRELLEQRAQGLSSPEGAALREQAFKGLDRQRQGDLRTLRGVQGGQGIRGPAAGAQQQSILRQAADRGEDLEQRLLLENVALRRQGTQDLQGELARQQAQNLNVQEFNARIANQENKLKTAFPFLFAGLGAQEQGTAAQTISSRDQLEASIRRGELPQAAIQGIDGPSGGGGILGGALGDDDELLRNILFGPVSAPVVKSAEKEGKKIWNKVRGR
jgi:hypothetical protein